MHAYTTIRLDRRQHDRLRQWQGISGSRSLGRAVDLAIAIASNRFEDTPPPPLKSNRKLTQQLFVTNGTGICKLAWNDALSATEVLKIYAECIVRPLRADIHLTCHDFYIADDQVRLFGGPFRSRPAAHRALESLPPRKIRVLKDAQERVNLDLNSSPILFLDQAEVRRKLLDKVNQWREDHPEHATNVDIDAILRSEVGVFLGRQPPPSHGDPFAPLQLPQAGLGYLVWATTFQAITGVGPIDVQLAHRAIKLMIHAGVDMTKPSAIHKAVATAKAPRR